MIVACVKGQMCPLWPATQASQSHQRQLLVLDFWGKEFAPTWLHTHWDLPTLSLMDQECSLQSHHLTFRLISFLIIYVWPL